ncbi:MAG: AAA family ATPase [Pseudomonadota bacterium]
MYEEFFGLSASPFKTAPDPDFLYWSSGHNMAFTMLRYGLVNRALITTITGGVGVGKTTLLRKLLDEIPATRAVGLISNMQAGRGELLHWALMAFDLEFGPEPYVKSFRTFQDFVISQYAAGKRVILIIDEAQNLSLSQMEELRMLSNINSEKDELLQIVLMGQPQLRELINHPDLLQFAQRITADYHLAALDARETEEYIQERLKIAGAAYEIFPTRTCSLVHQATGGVPRLINAICDMCLAYAFADGSKTVDESRLREFLRSSKAQGTFNQFIGLSDSPTLVRPDPPSAGRFK